MLWWLNDRSVKGLPDFPEFNANCLVHAVGCLPFCLVMYLCNWLVMKLFYLEIDGGTDWSFCDFHLNFSGTVCTSFQEIKSLPVIVLQSCILYRCTGTHLLSSICYLSLVLWRLSLVVSHSVNWNWCCGPFIIS